MHVSVLYNEVLDWVDPQPGRTYIDATLGYGGHTQGLLAGCLPDGRVLSFDQDATAIAQARERLGAAAHHLTTAHSTFANIGIVAPSLGFGQVDGIVFDLGLSSMQLDTGERGFSFRFDAPLDMRMDQSQGRTAADLVNTLSEADLREIFWRYGDEQQGRKLAKVIVDSRPIDTTLALADLIANNKPGSRHRQKTHPATKVFQALRIAVNDELGALEAGLPAAIQLLKPGGRIAVISFHSLEDRFVKNLFRDFARDCICPQQQVVCTCDWEQVLHLPRRNQAIKPSAEEIAGNPRSRSARLRIAEKVARST